MVETFTHTVVVQPGGIVEVRDPGLPEGRTVRVIVMIEEESKPGSIRRFLGAAPGLYATREDADAFISAERDAW